MALFYSISPFLFALVILFPCSIISISPSYVLVFSYIHCQTFCYVAKLLWPFLCSGFFFSPPEIFLPHSLPPLRFSSTSLTCIIIYYYHFFIDITAPRFFIYYWGCHNVIEAEWSFIHFSTLTQILKQLWCEGICSSWKGERRISRVSWVCPWLVGWRV